MAESLATRFKNAWNAFLNRSPTTYSSNYGSFSSFNPERRRMIRGGDKTIITSIYNRIAMDCAAVDIRHVRVDNENRFIQYVNSGLDNCLTLEANIDQTGRAFIQDIVMSLLDEGVVAVVPTDTNVNIISQNVFDILTMRVGKIVSWYPEHVTVELYNERNGMREQLNLPKQSIAIIENPLYSVMNSPNGTLQRLIRKLSLMDMIDEQNSSGKLDLIIQLPYIVKSEARKKQADERRKEIENQLTGSKYGIAYTDGTEKITQLNRSVENNLMSQVEYLTSMLYSQLGITQEIMNGTANEQAMLSYNNRAIEPIIAAIADEFKRKFISKTARTQGQSIEYFREPFRLVPANQLADIADKFTRNEIMTSNEFRQIIGMKPSDDPNADMLLNKNINHPMGQDGAPMESESYPEEEMQEQPQPEETVQENQNTQGEEDPVVQIRQSELDYLMSLLEERGEET